MLNPYRGWMIASLIFMALTYTPIFMSKQVLDAFVREDRIYESLSSIYLLVISVFFGIAFFRTRARFSIKEKAWIRKLAFLGFGLLFLFAAGEEISWGQRIFGLEAPNLIKEHNVQKELTLHNLEFLQGARALLPFSFSQLTSVFALTFGALIPLASRFSRRVREFLEPLFPVLPVACSLLFIANYAIQKAIIRLLPHFPQFYHHPSLNIPAGVLETREHGYSFALMLATIFYVLVKLRHGGEARIAAEVESADGISALPTGDEPVAESREAVQQAEE
jgi:hypothetical protein